jgi:hypothetical protein
MFDADNISILQGQVGDQLNATLSLAAFVYGPGARPRLGRVDRHHDDNWERRLMASKRRPRPGSERRARIVVARWRSWNRRAPGPKLLKSIKGDSGSSAPPTSTAASTGSGSTTTTRLWASSRSHQAGPVAWFLAVRSRGALRPIPKPAELRRRPRPGVGGGKAAAAQADDHHRDHHRAGAAATAPTTTTPTTTPARPSPSVPNGFPAAVVTVNGKKQLPAPVPGSTSAALQLAAIGKKGLKIGIVGGSCDGEQYLVLEQGEVTLLHQSDGSRFVIAS